MPSNQTPNYKLSQWERADKVQMEDFNADNAKLDAAIKAESDARTALAAQVAKKGNCRVWATSYIGTGTCGMNGPTSVTFPEKPLFAMILTPGSIEIAWITPGNGFLVYSKSNQLTWSGNTASWFHDYPNGEPQNQLNYKGSRYNVLAFFMTDK